MDAASETGRAVRVLALIVGLVAAIAAGLTAFGIVMSFKHGEPNSAIPIGFVFGGFAVVCAVVSWRIARGSRSASTARSSPDGALRSHSWRRGWGR